LVELMFSAAILSLILLMLVAITNQTASIWKYTSGRIEQFSGTRVAFEAVTRQLSQATLNVHYDYFNAAGEARTLDNAGLFVPKSYGRQSQLRFISGSMDRDNTYRGELAPALAADPTRPRPTHGVFFHAPLGLVENTATHGGLNSLLNTWGYYVEFDSDERERPPFLIGAAGVAPPRWRYRLMEFMRPSEKMVTYSKPNEWLTSGLNEPGTPSSHILAENVVALVMQPMLSPKDERELDSPPAVPGTALAPSYFYDTTKINTVGALNPRHQLPPTVRVTMVAIDEPSAIRLANGSTMPEFGLEKLFPTASSTSAADYQKDLAALEAKLSEMRCSYRVFTTAVAIRGAKWSKQ
jgi:uncharacterized protein (TIGR02599 family)